MQAAIQQNCLCWGIALCTHLPMLPVPSRRTIWSVESRACAAVSEAANGGRTNSSSIGLLLADQFLIVMQQKSRAYGAHAFKRVIQLMCCLPENWPQLAATGVDCCTACAAPHSPNDHGPGAICLETPWIRQHQHQQRRSRAHQAHQQQNRVMHN